MIDLQLSIQAMNEGIVPSFDSMEIAGMLDSCDPKIARKMKRKFRKLWRREMKQSLKAASTAEELRVIQAIFSLPVQRRNLVRRKLQKKVNSAS